MSIWDKYRAEKLAIIEEMKRTLASDVANVQPMGDELGILSRFFVSHKDKSQRDWKVVGNYTNWKVEYDECDCYVCFMNKKD